MLLCTNRQTDRETDRKAQADGKLQQKRLWSLCMLMASFDQQCLVLTAVCME